ncbi:septum formation initiator family protein [Romboutsia sp.]|uniref:FtsB family cell division protein n=1 Tax=Romboutsia sp. TaxID=1965302 RepID=UPI002D80DE04|nr:septum formation initiator family protein [Romboutsia sp.]
MNLRKIFSSQFLVISMFLIFMVFSLASGFVFQITKVKQYRSEIVNLNKQIDNTKEEIENLKKIGNTQDLETDARNRLNMVKPDEIIYVDIQRR